MSAPHLRSYIVFVRGFDFVHVYARAKSHSQARSVAARGFSDAGYGSFLEGLRHVTSVRLCPEAEALDLVESTRTRDGAGLLYGATP